MNIVKNPDRDGQKDEDTETSDYLLLLEWGTKFDSIIYSSLIFNPDIFNADLLCCKDK